MGTNLRSLLKLDLSDLMSVAGPDCLMKDRKRGNVKITVAAADVPRRSPSWSFAAFS